MSVLARSNDDLILDGLVSKIDTHRAADVLIDAAYNFVLGRDKTTPWQDLSKPLVNVELETDTGESPNKFTAHIRVLCLVPITDGVEDSVSVARLFVLKEQTRKALLDKSDRDFSQSIGVIGNPNTLKLTWTRIAFDDEKLNEDILAGAWTFDIDYGYEPIYPTGIALDSIKATLDGFSAVWTY